ncbi:MAG: glycosyltransferase [Candidatus Nealsonbacteria bacterium]|nr:glycosyltransferase [Candidatus Nealsonbacteria bacterium]
MDSFWFWAYLALAGLALLQAGLLAVQTWEHRRYARSCMRAIDRLHASGHAQVFAPCKGVDVELEGNLRAVLQQDYHDYEVTFVVETEDDPACEVIHRLAAENPQTPTRLVVAGRADQCGQKVHNLRAATAKLAPQTAYLAFVDSDARPRPQWLRTLVARLGQGDLGAVTGYRWFTPQRDSLANHLLYSTNCDVMSLFGQSSHYLTWGGSWTIRRDVFESIGLRDAWRGTLSDDLIASRELCRARRRVRFEPVGVVASPVDHTMRQMFSFIRRQYIVGRYYVPGWWLFAVAAATFTAAVWVGSLVAILTGLLYGTPPTWIPVSVFTVLYLLSVQRGMVRQDLVDVYFPGRRRKLRNAMRVDVWLSPVVAVVNWVAVSASLFGRSISWRGIRYGLARGGQIRSLVREDELQPTVTEQTDERPEPGDVVREFPTYRKTG